MYAFAKTPRWLAGHALFAVLLTIFVFAGFWQVSRYQQRSAVNNAVTSRQDVEAIEIGALLANTEPTEAEYRTVLVSGEFDGPDVILRSQALDGSPGCNILTKLVKPDGRAVIVNRGWIPLKACEAPEEAAITPPTEALTVTGRVRQSRQRGRFGAIDPAEGVLSIMARVDLDRLQQQIEQPLEAVYVEQVTPTTEGLLVRLPEPATDGGPHLGYAVQWFSFAAVAIVGYPIVLRNQARESRKG